MGKLAVSRRQEGAAAGNSFQRATDHRNTFAFQESTWPRATPAQGRMGPAGTRGHEEPRTSPGMQHLMHASTISMVLPSISPLDNPNGGITLLGVRVPLFRLQDMLILWPQ